MSQLFSKVGLISLEESVIAALAKLAPDASVPVEGKLAASKDLQAQLQAHVNTMKSGDEARTKVSQFAALDQSQRAVMIRVLAGIRNYAAGLYGELSPEFASFGFKPKKTGARTVESKAGALEKARATRVARHTMGKRQRSAIHGAVPTNPPPNTPVVAPPNTGTPIVAQPVTPVTPAPTVAQPVTPAPSVAQPVTPAPIVAEPAPAPATPEVNAAPAASVTNGLAH